MFTNTISIHVTELISNSNEINIICKRPESLTFKVVGIKGACNGYSISKEEYFDLPYLKYISTIYISANADDSGEISLNGQTVHSYYADQNGSQHSSNYYLSLNLFKEKDNKVYLRALDRGYGCGYNTNGTSASITLYFTYKD